MEVTMVLPPTPPLSRDLSSSSRDKALVLSRPEVGSWGGDPIGQAIETTPMISVDVITTHTNH